VSENGACVLAQLPEGWTWSRLEDLAAPELNALTDGPFGSNLKTDHYTSAGPRVIRLQNVGEGRFINERAHISEEHFDRLRKHEARAGDVVIAALTVTSRATSLPSTRTSSR
jgi:type I restriction enzyme, S subunit